MSFEQVNIETTDNWVVVSRLFFPSVIGIIVILGAYTWYRWRVAADRRDLDDLNPDRMRVKMDVLAAEKMALRKAKEEVQTAESDSAPTGAAGDEVSEEEPPIE